MYVCQYYYEGDFPLLIYIVKFLLTYSPIHQYQYVNVVQDIAFKNENELHQRV